MQSKDPMTSALDNFWASAPKKSTVRSKSLEDDAYDSFWGRNTYAQPIYMPKQQPVYTPRQQPVYIPTQRIKASDMAKIRKQELILQQIKARNTGQIIGATVRAGEVGFRGIKRATPIAIRGIKSAIPVATKVSKTGYSAVSNLMQAIKARKAAKEAKQEQILNVQKQRVEKQLIDQRMQERLQKRYENVAAKPVKKFTYMKRETEEKEPQSWTTPGTKSIYQ
jgi:hypothetical protein